MNITSFHDKSHNPPAPTRTQQAKHTRIHQNQAIHQNPPELTRTQQSHIDLSEYIRIHRNPPEPTRSHQNLPEPTGPHPLNHPPKKYWLFLTSYGQTHQTRQTIESTRTRQDAPEPRTYQNSPNPQEPTRTHQNQAETSRTT
jgi:hypothetical protein